MVVAEKEQVAVSEVILVANEAGVVEKRVVTVAPDLFDETELENKIDTDSHAQSNTDSDSASTSV